MPKRSASRVEDSEASGEGVVPKTTKRSKTSGSGAAAKDADGNPFWELSAKRRVTLSEFNGKAMVNIREYYEKDGRDLPGKKGISLTIEQYQSLLHAIPGINEELRSQGKAVDDPAFDRLTTAKTTAKEKSKRSNIEATSDEDEDDG